MKYRTKQLVDKSINTVVVLFWLLVLLGFLYLTVGGLLLSFFRVNSSPVDSKSNAKPKTKVLSLYEQQRSEFNKEYSEIISTSRRFMIEELELHIKHRLTLLKLFFDKEMQKRMYSVSHTNNNESAYYKHKHGLLTDDYIDTVAVYSALTVYSNDVDDVDFLFTYPYSLIVDSARCGRCYDSVDFYEEIPLSSFYKIKIHYNHDNFFPAPVKDAVKKLLKEQLNHE